MSTAKTVAILAAVLLLFALAGGQDAHAMTVIP